MGSFFAKFSIITLLACLVAALTVFIRTGDPLYGLREDLHGSQWTRFDAEIARAGLKYRVDPLLVRALIWRESRFGPDKRGAAGERGLMQVTTGAATDYARATGTPAISPDDLFRPEINIEVGTWYLGRAMEHYQGKDDPVPFALSEYNAGRTRVKRWSRDDGTAGTGASEMKKKSFDSTRAYVESIERRYAYYRERYR